jgi:hypothetical protein
MGTILPMPNEIGKQKLEREVSAMKTGTFSYESLQEIDGYESSHCNKIRAEIEFYFDDMESVMSEFEFNDDAGEIAAEMDAYFGEGN